MEAGSCSEKLPLVVMFDVVTGDDGWAAHRHNDFFSLYLVQRGRGTHVIDGVSYGIARGDVYAMGIGMAHYYADCEDLITDTLHFAPSIFDAATLDVLADTPGF